MTDVLLFDSLWSCAVRDRHPLATDRYRDLFLSVHAQNPDLAELMLDADRLMAHASPAGSETRTLAEFSAFAARPTTPAVALAAWLDPGPLPSPPRPWSDEDWERDRRRADAAGIDVVREEWEAYAEQGRDLVGELFEEESERARSDEEVWRKLEVEDAKRVEAEEAVAEAVRQAAEAEAEGRRQDEAAARRGDLSRAARLVVGGAPVVIRPSR